MKILKIIITVWLAGVFFPLHSQNWQSVGGGVSGLPGSVRGLFVDTIDNLLYAVGTFEYAGDSLTLQIAVWDGNNWKKIGSGTGDTNCQLGCHPLLEVIKYNNYLFTGGDNDMMDGNIGCKNLSRWDGYHWDSCGKPNSTVWGLIIANNELFAMGYFDTISNKPANHIAKWNDTVWNAFGTYLPFGGGSVNTAAFYKGEYYFGGNFELGNGLKEIIRWNGSQWDSLENGVLGNAWINTMAVYKNILFVGGYFFQSSGNPADFLIAWDGQHWFNPFPGIYFMEQVFDLEVFNNKLYIVGNHIFAGDSGMYAFASYDGTNFCPFGGRAIYPYYPDPIRIAVLNGNIYVACNKTLFSDTVNYIAKLIGSPVDTAIYMPLSVNIITINKNTLSIYPNPAEGNFTAQFTIKGDEQAELTIYDVLGKEIKSISNIKGNGLIQVPVDLSYETVGVYFVHLWNGTVSLTAKIIKQ